MKKKNRQLQIFLVSAGFFLFIITQIVLGVFVLLTGANILIASMHQISSIFLIISALRLYHRSIRS